jgi:hypothetical protein
MLADIFLHPMRKSTNDRRKQNLKGLSHEMDWVLKALIYMDLGLNIGRGMFLNYSDDPPI